jgi:hypothetical protein
MLCGETPQAGFVNFPREKQSRPLSRVGEQNMRMMIPPFDQLKPGELADFYAVKRDDQVVMVARQELSLHEIREIADELRLEGQSDLDIANGLDN